MAVGRLVIGMGVLGALVLGWFALSDNPMPAETTAASPEGTALAVVTVPDSLSDQAKIGQRAFGGKCAACHGENAAGQEGVAPPLVHKVYEPGHHGDMSFVPAAQNGVRAHHWPFGDMPPVEGLTQGDVLNIVAYVRELQRASGIN